MTCFPAITSEPAPVDSVIRNELTLNHCRYSCGFASIRGFNTSPPPRTSFVVEPKRLRDAGQLLGIKVLDHLIVTDSAYLSLKEDEGW